MNRKITKYTLEKATEHLSYEISLFYQTLVFLTQPRPQIEVNILLDSFAIHTRNLFDFFYPKKNTKPDDMLVSDFIGKSSYFSRNKTKKKDLIFVVRKADKQVAHLTYARNRYNQNTKRWPFVAIGIKMIKTLNAFYKALPNSYKNWTDFKELKKVNDSLQNSFNA